MKFEHIDLFWVCIVVSTLLAVFFVFSWRKKRYLMKKFVMNSQLQIGVSTWLQQFRMLLIFLGFTMAFLSLARPQWGRSEQEFVEKGIDVIVAIDTSKSLLAEDLLPNRFERIRLAVSDMTQNSRGNRFGLVVFAGSAFLQTPLTSDPGAIRQTLAALSVGMIPSPGSDFDAALQECAKAFDSDNNRYKAVVFFSDGEHHGKEIRPILKALVAQKIKVFSVGAATAEGELIPLRDGSSQTDFLRDSNGNVVKSRLDSQLLTEIAETTGGFYVNLQDLNAVEKIMDQGIDKMPKADLSTKKFSQMNEQFQWPLSIAVVLLLVEFILPYHSYQRQKSNSSIKVSASVALGALLWICPVSARTESPSKASSAYENGKYAEARSRYAQMFQENPDDPRIAFNLASSEYQLKNYAEAARIFESILKAEDINLQQKAYYGLGNTRFLQGELLETPEEKITHWKSSLEALEAASKLNPQDRRSASNHAFVQKKIQDLEQNQDDQEQNQEQDQDKKDPSEKNKENKDQQKSDQSGSTSDQEKDERQDKQPEEKEDKDNPDKNSEEQDQQPEKDKSEVSAEEDKDNKSQSAGTKNSNKPEADEKNESDQRQPPAPDPNSTDSARNNSQDAQPMNAENQDADQLAAGDQETRMSREQIQNFLKSMDQQSRFLLLQPTNRVSRDPRYTKDW